jgi:drug/metabolite transporter (DMT)-like permease
MAALLVGSLPLWVLGLEAVAPGGTRPTWLGVGGILLGLAGVALLVWPTLAAGAQAALWAQGLVLVATLLWAIGTLIGRRVAVPRSGVYNSAFQMIAAALGFMGLSVAFGEPARFQWEAVSRDAWLAWAYLVVFGSCIAFSAFAWLVQRVKPEVVSTYAYVNPVVAVALGAWLLKEPVDGWTLVGAALVVVSVGLVIRGGRPKAAPAHAEPEAVAAGREA